jgi:serine/threonine-protein kinase
VIGAGRFLREIKTIATLQHPHILGLIDSGEVNGTAYYVMPFVEGESLRDRLRREKQLAIHEAVRLATEVASALDYAHRHGVVHRDVKPENILLHDGSALVADFGIALAVSTAGSSRMTETGMSLGTPHYMSPEQAMGEREITARSDIYALGCVLYEMLTGEPPFEGATAQAIVARVLTESPRPLRAQRKSIPPQVEAAVLTALEKLPADRFESARAFAEALGDPGYIGSSGARTRVLPSALGAGRGTGSSRWLLGGALALGAAAGLAAGWATWHHRPAIMPPPAVLRYSVPLPDSAGLVDVVATELAYAPDGSVFAYSSTIGLMLRYADRLEPVVVPGGRRGIAPFFSPDSRWLGFQNGATLVKVPLAGGAPVTICDSCPGYSFSWAGDDTIRYHTAPPPPDDANERVLMAVSSQGGRPREFARPDRGSGEAFRSPVLLPGRRTVLFAAYRDAASRLASVDLRTGRITRLDQAGFGPQWVNGGFLVLSYADGSLIALPFDPDRVRATGPPETIARDVAQPDAYTPRAAVAADGSIIYPRAGGATPRHLMLVSRTGQATLLVPDAKAFHDPRFSPDGRRVAFDINDQTSSGRDVWVFDLVGKVWSRLTTDGISDRPIWTPDGRRLVYSSNDDLWWIAADGSSRPDTLLVAAGSRFGGSVTPDGRTLVFEESGGANNGIRTLVFDSAPAARMIIPAAFNESAPALSPDGHWLAYQSDQTGKMGVYVQSFPVPGARIPVSLQGGTEPVWAHNGRELYYRSADSLVVASVSLSLGFAVTGRRTLFAGSFLSGGAHREYDVSPDDQHFIMISGEAGQMNLIGIQNVFQRMLYERRMQQ